MPIKPRIISGVCKCGCSWEDHHLSMIVNPDSWAELQRIAPDHPPYFPDECCNYGNNETGGLKYNEETEVWEEHCLSYIDAEAPLNGEELSIFLKLILAYIFYYLGDLISYSNRLACKSPWLDWLVGFLRLPDLYQIFMRWSVTLDSTGKVWKFVNDEQKA